MNYRNKFIFFLLSTFMISCSGKLQESQYYFELGKVQEERQQLDSAALSYRKAIEVLGNSDNIEQKGKIYNQLGNLFLNAGLYMKAMDAFNKAIKSNLLLPDKTNLSSSLRGKGKSFLYNNKLDSALCYFLKAAELSDQIKNIKEILLINDNLSSVHYFLNQYDKAYLYNQKALSLSKDSTDLFRGWYAKGDILMELQQYDSAWHYYELASRSTSIYTKAGCYWAISELTRTLQLPDSSKYLKLFTIIHDSIERLDQRVQVNSIDSQYLEKKNLVKERKSFATLIVFITIVGALLFLFFILRYKKRLKKERNKLEEEQKKISLLHEEKLAIQNKLDSQIENEKNIAERAMECERIEQIQRDLITNIKNIAENCTKDFFRQNIYQEIKCKLRKDSSLLTNADRRQLYDVITKTYQPFIYNLAALLNLSEDDCYVCCLSLSKFTTKEASYLKKISWDAVRSQKTRIKKKNLEILHSLELFEFIFNKSNSNSLFKF